MEGEAVQVSRWLSRRSAKLSLFVSVLAVAITVTGARSPDPRDLGEDGPGKPVPPNTQANATQANAGPVAPIVTAQPATEAAPGGG